MIKTTCCTIIIHVLTQYTVGNVAITFPHVGLIGSASATVT